jgi:hypothetical protein
MLLNERGRRRNVYKTLSAPRRERERNAREEKKTKEKEEKNI